MANSVPVYSNRTTTVTLGATTNDTATINLAEGDGALFPSPGAEEFVPAVILNRSTGTYEEIDITSRSGDALTVVRARGGTTAVPWADGSELFVDLPARELDLMRRTLRIASTEDAQVLVDGSPVLTVDGGTGNVGIGVAPASGRRLHVKGASGAFAYIQLEGATGQDALFQLTPGDGTKNWLVQASNSSGDLLLANNSANPAIRIRQTREVGIGVQPTTGNRFQVGTTATSTALVVADGDGTCASLFDGSSTSPNFAAGASEDFKFWHDGTNSWQRNFTGNLYIGTSGAALLSFQTSSLTRAYFDGNGAFILGNAAIQSGAKLDIQTTGQAHALYVADATGQLVIPWDGGSSSWNISIANRLGVYHTGSGGAGAIRCSTGTLFLTSTGASVDLQASGSTVLSATTRGTAQITPLGSDPGSPQNGDIWVTTAGALKFRANGTTYTVTAT